MPTREIPSREWQQFFDLFSQQHDGCLTTVEVLDREEGDHIQIDGLPLQGIAYEPKGSDVGDVTITAGTTPDRRLVRRVDSASRVWVREEEDEKSIEIEARVESARWSGSSPSCNRA